MSWASILATGSGKLGVRIAIEGLPIEFVSDPSLERAGDLANGIPERVYCLQLFGEDGSPIELAEDVNVPEAVLEGTGGRITLFETKAEHLSQVFGRSPSLTRFLVESVDEAADTLTLLSTDGIAEGDILHAGTEAMLVLSWLSATEIEVERGVLNTIPRALWTSDDPTGEGATLMLTDVPLRTRGRRIRFYVYGSADDPQGDGGNGGEPIWRGVVSMEPRLDETKWSIGWDPVSSLFDTDMGVELELPQTPRGIF